MTLGSLCRSFTRKRESSLSAQSGSPLSRGRTENILLIAALARDSISRMPMLARARAAAREREQNLPADAGRGLAAAIGEKDDADRRSGNHADRGRGDVEPAVLVDDEAIAVHHALPGERLGEALVHLEDALLRQRHRGLQIALIRQRAEV